MKFWASKKSHLLCWKFHLYLELEFLCLHNWHIENLFAPFLRVNLNPWRHKSSFELSFFPLNFIVCKIIYIFFGLIGSSINLYRNVCSWPKTFLVTYKTSEGIKNPMIKNYLRLDCRLDLCFFGILFHFLFVFFWHWIFLPKKMWIQNVRAETSKESRKLAKRSPIKIYIKSELDKSCNYFALFLYTKHKMIRRNFRRLSIIRYVNDEFYVFSSKEIFVEAPYKTLPSFSIRTILSHLTLVVGCWVSDSIQLNELERNYEKLFDRMENPFILRFYDHNLPFFRHLSQTCY